MRVTDGNHRKRGTQEPGLEVLAAKMVSVVEDRLAQEPDPVRRDRLRAEVLAAFADIAAGRRTVEEVLA